MSKPEPGKTLDHEWVDKQVEFPSTLGAFDQTTDDNTAVGKLLWTDGLRAVIALCDPATKLVTVAECIDLDRVRLLNPDAVPEQVTSVKAETEPVKEAPDEDGWENMGPLKPTFLEPWTADKVRERWANWSETERYLYKKHLNIVKKFEETSGQAATYAAYQVEIISRKRGGNPALHPTFVKPLTQDDLTFRWAAWSERERELYNEKFNLALPHQKKDGEAANYAAFAVEVTNTDHSGRSAAKDENPKQGGLFQ